MKVLRPEILKGIYQLREECYYQLRSRASLFVPLVSAAFNSTGGIRFLGPKIWEIIPYELKHFQNLQEFKTAIKKDEINIIPVQNLQKIS